MKYDNCDEEESMLHLKEHWRMAFFFSFCFSVPHCLNQKSRVYQSSTVLYSYIQCFVLLLTMDLNLSKRYLLLVLFGNWKMPDCYLKCFFGIHLHVWSSRQIVKNHKKCFKDEDSPLCFMNLGEYSCMFCGPTDRSEQPCGFPQVLSLSLQLSKASVLVNHPNHLSIMQSRIHNTQNVLAAIHGT